MRSGAGVDRLRHLQLRYRRYMADILSISAIANHPPSYAVVSVSNRRADPCRPIVSTILFVSLPARRILKRGV